MQTSDYGLCFPFVIAKIIKKQCHSQNTVSNAQSKDYKGITWTHVSIPPQNKSTECKWIKANWAHKTAQLKKSKKQTKLKQQTKNKAKIKQTQKNPKL